MALEIAVGPQKLVLNQGAGFAVTEQDGQINWPTDKGVYFSDTRVISTWRIYADGEPWDLLNSGNIAFFAARIFLANRRLITEAGEIAAGTLGLTIGRSLEGGLHEDLDLVNHGARTARFNLEIAMRSDFADLFEVKSGAIVRRGHVVTSWSRARQTLATSYENEDFHRRVTVQVRRADTQAVYANGRLSFDIELAPGATWHACLLYAFANGGTRHSAPRECVEHCLQARSAKRLADWQAQALSLNTSTDHLGVVPAAGIPWFVGLFGRDSLIVSLQNAMVYPDFPRGSLEVLGRLQARKRDDYRDAEPGKIMHELRTGELAHFKLIPHTPYYGTADATPLYLIVLHNAWRSTGDAGLLDRHMATAERCLEWIDKYGDRDGDGFQEYQTRSTAGYENQGWKDSGEALVYPDGSLVKGPKALCELQGYVYDAWRRMAEIYDALGKPQRATGLRTKAANLYRRFNETFWDEDAGFYAFCLDGDKKPVWSVASNPGHCLWSGIVPRDRAARVVKRLMADDMWSGWGIRTLSSKHAAFNPHSYQNGSVWPHDNGLIALGFRRYGFADETAMIARDISRAASYFEQHRMPELYAGLQREPTNFPVQYLGANVPQAWAAGSCFWLLQAMLGFQADAPAGKLYLDPALPEWMPDVALKNIKIGRRSFDIRFLRQGDGKTTWEVLRGDARAVSQRDIATYGGEDVG
jgi:glycogen debranching enzyme